MLKLFGMPLKIISVSNQKKMEKLPKLMRLNFKMVSIKQLLKYNEH